MQRKPRGGERFQRRVEVLTQQHGAGLWRGIVLRPESLQPDPFRQWHSGVYERLAVQALSLLRGQEAKLAALMRVVFENNLERTIRVIVDVLTDLPIIRNDKETANRTLKNVFRNRGRVG